MNYLVILLIVAFIIYLLKFKNKKKQVFKEPKSLDLTKIDSTVKTPKRVLTPFEAAQKIKDLYTEANATGFFDRKEFERLVEIKKDPIGGELAVNEINKKDVVSALLWYYHKKGYLRFWFSDEAYNLMSKKINTELNPSTFKLEKLNDLYVKIKYLKLSITNEKHKEIIGEIYSKQEALFIPEALKLETPVKISINLQKHEKNYICFSPYIKNIINSLKNLEGYDELYRKKKNIASRISKTQKTKNIEKLNILKEELQINKEDVKKLITDKINSLKPKN